jgi:hypothetical protein
MLKKLKIFKLLINLPQDIQSKICIYYLSYGTYISNVIHKEIYEKCMGRPISLWSAQNKKYMLYNYVDCPYNVLCDLRLAIVNNDPSNTHLIKKIHHFLKRYDAIRISRLLLEEKLLLEENLIL